MSTTVITVVLLQNCMDLRSGELGSDGGMCATSSEVGIELIRVQQGVTKMAGFEDPRVG